MRFLRDNLLLLALLLSVVGVTAGLASAPAASAQGVFNNACNPQGANGGGNGSAICSATGANNLSGPNGIINKVSNIFAFVGGVAAVFIIMIGGFMYITAGGDASKANSGRSAVIYACVGLVVIVLGRTIIRYVISHF